MGLKMFISMVPVDAWNQNFVNEIMHTSIGRLGTTQALDRRTNKLDNG